MDRKRETAPVIPGRTDSDESTVRCLAAKNVVEQHFSNKPEEYQEFFDFAEKVKKDVTAEYAAPDGGGDGE